MAFWYCFVLFCIGVLWVNIHLKNKFVTNIFVFILWIISSFRYMIGPDYDQYTDIYYNADMYFAIVPIEPSFQYLVLCLHSLGFDVQTLFIIYSTVSIYVFYFAVRKILKQERQIIIAMVLFAVNIHMYWFSMSGIRQAAAISIVMYLVFFLINKKYIMYLVGMFITFFVHYSSILCLILIFIRKNIISFKKYVSMVIISYLIGYLKIVPFLFLAIFSNWDSEFNKYADYAALMVEGATYTFNLQILIDAIFLGIVIYYIKDRVEKEIMIINIASIYIFVSIMSNYYITDLATRDMIVRFSIYFIPYYLLALVFFIDYLLVKYKNRVSALVVVFFYSLMFLRGLSLYDHNQEGMALPSRSNANINYEMNFKLLK